MARLDLLINLHNENPSDEFTLYALGKEYEKQQNFQKAEHYYLKLIEVNENYVGVYYHIAALYLANGERALAEKYYNTGIEIAEKINDLHALSELKAARLNMEYEG